MVVAVVVADAGRVADARSAALVVGAGSLVAGYLSALRRRCVPVCDRLRSASTPTSCSPCSSRTEFKSFVRLHIDDKGNLDLFAFGIPEIVAMWHKSEIPEPAAVDEAGVIWRPVLVPTAANDDEPPPYVELIEHLTFPPN